jgi:hypothetical protein
METIKDALQSFMRTLQQRKKDSDGDHYVALKKVLTKKEFGHIKIHYFRQGILVVAVDSSSWLYHFNIKKQAVVQRLQGCRPVVKDIQFYLGES